MIKLARDSERGTMLYLSRGTQEGGVYLWEAQGAGAPTEPRTEPLVEVKSAAREPLPCLEPCLEPYLARWSRWLCAWVPGAKSGAPY